jgi:hypothetical protein
LQGPHHSAQKSTIAGISDFMISVSKVSSVTWSKSAMPYLLSSFLKLLQINPPSPLCQPEGQEGKVIRYLLFEITPELDAYAQAKWICPPITNND